MPCHVFALRELQIYTFLKHASLQISHTHHNHHHHRRLFHRLHHRDHLHRRCRRYHRRHLVLNFSTDVHATIRSNADMPRREFCCTSEEYFASFDFSRSCPHLRLIVSFPVLLISEVVVCI